MTASVTQAISCAVIAVEITDNTNYLLPCLLAAVIASGECLLKESHCKGD